jgi:hypothetical protein
MLSIGDDHYTKDAGPASVFDNQQNLVGTVQQVMLKGLKVGDIPQTTAALTADINVLPQLKIGAIYNYFANYTTRYTFSNLTQQTLTSNGATAFTPYKVPDFSLWSLNGVFRFKMGGFDSELIATINNLLNTRYISDAYDADALGRVANVSGYYGLGRVFTTGLKVKF